MLSFRFCTFCCLCMQYTLLSGVFCTLCCLVYAVQFVVYSVHFVVFYILYTLLSCEFNTLCCLMYSCIQYTLLSRVFCTLCFLLNLYTSLFRVFSTLFCFFVFLYFVHFVVSCIQYTLLSFVFCPLCCLIRECSHGKLGSSLHGESQQRLSCPMYREVSRIRLFRCCRSVSRDSWLVRAPDSSSKSCEFQSRQERRENFLLQS